MPKFKKISRNYRDLLTIVGLPDGFANVSRNDDSLETIKKDLPRTPFVDFNGKTTASLRNSWEQEDVSHAYTQGNMTGAVFSAAWQIFVLGSPEFIRENPKRTDADRMLIYAQKDNLCFAYYDDEGTPCGFSLSYSKKDPSLWTATIIKNTMAAPEDRTVTTFCPEEMTLHPGDEQLAGNEVLADILPTVNSTSIQQVLKNIVNKKGEVNLDELTLLQERIKSDHNIDNRDEKQIQLNELMEGALAARPNNTHLETSFARIKQQAVDDIEFFKDDNFASTCQSIAQVVAFEDNLADFHQRLKALEARANTPDEKKFHEKGVALFNQVKKIAGTDPSTLPMKDLSDLNHVLKTSTTALDHPKDGKTIGKLGALAETVSGKASSFWKGLGAALLAFTGTALVVAGVLGAIPTAGASLALVVAGAAALTLASGVLIKKGSEQGLAKAVSNFKSALGEIKKENLTDEPELDQAPCPNSSLV